MQVSAPRTIRVRFFYQSYQPARVTEFQFIKLVEGALVGTKEGTPSHASRISRIKP
jgi:hypothetical protein